MTTSAREVEALLRSTPDNMGSCHECFRDLYPPNTHRLLAEAASALSALIAECETAKAELAEAVKLLRSCSNDLETQITIYYSPFQPDKYPHNARKMALEMMPVVEARVFIAKHAPTPELITGEVGEEKGETK